jgi:glycosyltransferase involved in cell wall biosynthesis
LKEADHWLRQGSHNPKELTVALGVKIRNSNINDDGRSVSIVITVHNEGTLLAKCVESCRRALSAAGEYFSASEIILVCDRPDTKSRELAELLQRRRKVAQVHITDFGDPGLARNAGVGFARGTFVTFVDADDLINEQYIRQLLFRAYRGTKAFLRPSIVLTFGDEKSFLLQFDSQDIANNEIMIYSNPWAMPVLGRRDAFLAHPFPADAKSNGYSHEDWEWNLSVLDAGGEFEAIEGVTYFARRRLAGSRTAEARAFQYVVKPSRFYRNKVNFTAKASAAGDLNQKFRQAMVGRFDNTAYYFADPIYMRDFRSRSTHSALDHFMRHGKRDGALFRNAANDDNIASLVANAVIESMILLSDLDGSLDPQSYWDGSVNHYDVFIGDRDTTLWRDVLDSGILDRRWDVVFVLPWVRKGGADLVALKHISACREMGLSVCAITTLDHPIEWSDRLPVDVPIVEFGRLSRAVSPIIGMEVFHRLLIELQPSVIHNVNSELFWQVLKRNGLSIRANTKVVCSLYCQDYNEAGSSVGYDRYIDSCDTNVDGYVTDNSVYADYLTEKLGVAEEKIVVCSYPIEIGYVNARKTRFDKTRKVLWASRFDYQKGIDFLGKVSQAVPDLEFHFFGEVMLGNASMDDIMLPQNQVYRGKFSHIEEIDPNEFDAFLYTARWDGLPNIVLEAGLKGIPVVSFTTGGLSDVLSEETAWPANDLSVQSLVDQLRLLYTSDDLGELRAISMHELLSKKHASEAFRSDCQTLYELPVQTMQSPEVLNAS